MYNVDELNRIKEYRQIKEEIRRSDKYLVVGIDVGKEKHYAHYRTANGKTLHRRLVFWNTFSDIEMMMDHANAIKECPPLPTLTTVWVKGDIIPVTEHGRWVTVFMIMSGIIFIPWQVSQIVKEWIHMGSKTDVICPGCGLSYHDKDASHCKSCGHVIYQEFED